jgi:hypothetical protein
MLNVCLYTWGSGVQTTVSNLQVIRLRNYTEGAKYHTRGEWALISETWYKWRDSEFQVFTVMEWKFSALGKGENILRFGELRTIMG